MEKDNTSSVRAGDVGAPATFGSFAPETRGRRKEKMVDLAPYQGPAEDEQ
jgi:hypothetical protein